MTRLIDADALKEKLKKERVWMEYTAEMSVEQIAEEALLSAKQTVVRFVDEMPTVEAVPVIRCKDCAYYRPYSDGKMDCDNLFGMADVDPDGYCSRAERKEE